jgi:hypothetical protein
LPSWRDFKDKVSEFEQRVNNKIAIGAKDFSDKHPLIAMAFRGSLHILPPPLDGIAEYIYDNFNGSDEEKFEQVKNYLKCLQNQGEEHYNKIAPQLENIAYNIKELSNSAAKQDTLLEIKNMMISEDININQAVHNLNQKLEEVIKNQKELKIVSSQYNQTSGRAEELVSYTVLEVDQTDYGNTIQEIASAINVKLNEGNQELPFVFPNGFQDWKGEHKLFLYGVNGCGKSRVVFEILKERIMYFQNIYVVNPQSPPSVKTRSSTISELVHDIVKEKDLIIWDNFPDPLELGQQIDSGYEALARISSSNVINLIMTLQPFLLKPYIKNIFKVPYLSKHEIAYDEGKIKDIVQTYGQNILEFKKVWSEIINSQSLPQISKAIWQREPTPFSVLLCYKELIRKFNDEPELISTGMAWLFLEGWIEEFQEPTTYYNSQFELIRSDRQTDAEFLYTLKLCYELKLKRDINSVNQLQMSVFQSVSEEPSRRLSTWLYFIRGELWHVLCDIPSYRLSFS